MKHPLDPGRAMLVAQVAKQLAFGTDVDVVFIAVLKRSEEGGSIDAGLHTFGRSEDDTALGATRVPIDRALLTGALLMLHAMGGGTETDVGPELHYPELET